MNIKKYAKCPILKSCTIGVVKNSRNVTAAIHIPYLQLIIPQYFISNKSGIWSLSLIVHSKG